MRNKIFLFFLILISFCISQNNYLKNPGFEKGDRIPDNWKCDTWAPTGKLGEALLLTKEKASEGEKSVKIDTSLTEADYIELKQGLPNELKGKKVILSGRFYIEKIEGEGAGEIYFRVRQFDKEWKLIEDALRTWVYIKKDELRIAETKLVDDKPVLQPQKIYKDFIGKWISFKCSGIVSDTYGREMFITIPTKKGLKGTIYIDDLVLEEGEMGESFKFEIEKEIRNYSLKGKVEIPDDWGKMSGFLYVEKIKGGHLKIRKELELPLKKGENEFRMPLYELPPDEYTLVFIIKQQDGRGIKTFSEKVIIRD